MIKYIIIILTSLPGLIRGEEFDRKTLEALRTDNHIIIDGQLDEEAWITAEVAKDFLTLNPVPGLPASFETEVRILFNDNALYIGAQMIDPEPDKIMRQLTSRDDTGNASYFSIILDPYQTGINGVGFTITSAGVQGDFKVNPQNEDDDWDAVWKSDVQITEFGWVVEIEIPYSAIRFPQSEIQNWNINFCREIRRLRETSYWNKIDPKVDGLLNQSGTLTGINNIDTPIRLMITPYVSGSASINTKEKSTFGTAYSLGADLKYGINDAFTLDMTLIPDFSQVRFDEQVLNLSPFEVQFDENRAFFTEGTELFNKADLFYSRRIGGAPFHLNKLRALEGEGNTITSFNQKTQLINATKVSGRLESGLGFGIFNAISNESYASYLTPEGLEKTEKINPLTNFSLLVADQQFKNNSYLSFINTNVMRFGSEYDANVTGTEFAFRDRNQMYQIAGSSALSQKYLVEETSIGYAYEVSLEKISGNTGLGIEYSEKSPDFDINDLGFLQIVNERSIEVSAQYNEFDANFLNVNRYRFFISSYHNRLVSPNVFYDHATTFGGFFRTKNFLGTGFNFRVEPINTYDYFEPRTPDYSRYYTFPTNFMVTSFFSTNYNRPIALDMDGGYRIFGEEGRSTTFLGFKPRWRVSDQFSLIWSYDLVINKNDVGFVNNSIDIPEIDNPIIFGKRDRTTMENGLTAKVIFNENMFINIIGRHYFSKVIYNSYHVLGEDGSLLVSPFTTLETPGGRKYDQNFNLFNLDVVYNWRFAPGSDLVFVIKNFANNSNAPNDLRIDYFDSLKNIYRYNNNFSVNLKVLYFLDYFRLMNK